MGENGEKKTNELADALVGVVHARTGATARGAGARGVGRQGGDYHRRARDRRFGGPLRSPHRQPLPGPFDRPPTQAELLRWVNSHAYRPRSSRPPSTGGSGHIRVRVTPPEQPDTG